MLAALLALLAQGAAVGQGAERPVAHLEIRKVEAGLELVSQEPVQSVQLFNERHELHSERALAAPSSTVWLPLPPEPGNWSILAQTEHGPAEGLIHLDSPEFPLDIQVEAPMGRDPLPISDGSSVEVGLLEGSSLTIALHLRAWRPTLLSLEMGEDTQELRFDATGVRELALFPLKASSCSSAPLRVRAMVPGLKSLDFEISCRKTSAGTSQDSIQVVESYFPTDVAGRVDLARPSGLVTLPSRSWRGILSMLHLGTRPRSDQAPWAWQSCRLKNLSPQDATILVRLRVVDAKGAAVHAFRPRLREADGSIQYVSALLRIPGEGEATAILPLYVDDRDPALDTGRHPPWFRELALIPLGGAEPLITERLPLHVHRGSTWATTGLLLGVVAAVAGLLLMLLRLGTWLRSFQSSELVTVALFSTLSFLVGSAAWLIGMAAGTLLGPFAPLITGLIDDTFRTVLMATLISLLPRRGVVTLALVVGWLLRGLTFGSFHPLDVLSLGSTVFFLESLVHLFRLDRPRPLSERPLWRWLRLSATFGPAALLTMLVSLSVAVVFYRLYYADLYVALMLGLPGLLYVVIACAIAVPFAASLERVES